MPPDPNLNTGTTRAQAKLNQAVAMRSNADKVEDFQDADQNYKNKLSKKSGWGRFFGAVALGGAALLTGGSALVIAGAAGIGSRVGNELGERSADKHDRPDELKEEDINYFKDDVKQINRDIEQFDADFDKNQWIDAGKDAWTAYNLANTASAYGAEAGAKVGSQKPIEGVKKMWGDSAEWGSNLMGKKAGDVASSDLGGKVLGETITRAGRKIPVGKPLENVGKKVVKQAGRQLTGNEMKSTATDTAISALDKIGSTVSNINDKKDIAWTPKTSGQNWLNW